MHSDRCQVADNKSTGQQPRHIRNRASGVQGKQQETGSWRKAMHRPWPALHLLLDAAPSTFLAGCYVLVSESLLLKTGAPQGLVSSAPEAWLLLVPLTSAGALTMGRGLVGGWVN